MITPLWVQAMAAYNAELNRRLITAAETLPEAQRHEDAGAFFGSIHGTLNHLLWGDLMWMHRFDGWPKPAVAIADSARFTPDWTTLSAARPQADARIQAWATQLDASALAGDLTWFSGITQQAMTQPRWLLVTHMFNHQTHHRGQAHALLTRFGAKPAATDLPWVIAEADYTPRTSAS